MKKTNNPLNLIEERRPRKTKHSKNPSTEEITGSPREINQHKLSSKIKERGKKAACLT